MLYAVYVAVCAATVPVAECNVATGLAWVSVPQEAPGLAACQILGQQYVAQARLVDGESYAKVYCKPVAMDGAKRSVG